MIEHHFVDVDRILLHVETAGVPGAEPVVLLHGWPDLAATFHREMRTLASNGYYAVAPDQRGYGFSGKPPAVADYQMPELVNDIRRLIERDGLGAVHLVGHDWGAAVAWGLASAHPELVRSLTVINCPHPDVFARALLTNPRQMLRSWYMLAIQLPGLVEGVLGARGGAALASMLRHGAGVNDEDLGAHRAAWAQPGAIQRPLFWYRAMARNLLTSMLRRDRSVPDSTVDVPTQIIWGRRDRAFVPSLAGRSAQRCDPPAALQWIDARHWPHHDRPEEVSSLLLDWIASHRVVPTKV